MREREGEEEEGEESDVRMWFEIFHVGVRLDVDYLDVAIFHKCGGAACLHDHFPPCHKNIKASITLW